MYLFVGLRQASVQCDDERRLMSDLPLPDPAATPVVLDIQHDTDPAEEHGNAKRIPHLGHALLYYGLTLFCTFVGFIVVLVPVLRHMTAERLMRNPGLLGLAQVLGYVLTLAIAVPLFSSLWHRSFLSGISWTVRAAKLQWWKLILLGFVLSIGALTAERFVSTAPETEIMKLFTTPLLAWLTALFGALLGPVFEEIAFRGFLLPALATAYDWLSLERTPAGLQRWQQTSVITPAAWWFGSVFSSLAFAGIHGSQLHWAAGALLILFVVSMVLSAVRVRTQSVAASSLVHASYNSLIFMLMIAKTGGFRHLEKLSTLK